jgi:hypothetical protein
MTGTGVGMGMGGAAILFGPMVPYMAAPTGSLAAFTLEDA